MNSQRPSALFAPEIRNSESVAVGTRDLSAGAGSKSSRALGLVGILGGAVLLAAFLPAGFDPAFNMIRLALFNIGAMAAVHRRASACGLDRSETRARRCGSGGPCERVAPRHDRHRDRRNHRRVAHTPSSASMPVLPFARPGAPLRRAPGDGPGGQRTRTPVTWSTAPGSNHSTVNVSVTWTLSVPLCQPLL